MRVACLTPPAYRNVCACAYLFSFFAFASRRFVLPLFRGLHSFIEIRVAPLVGGARVRMLLTTITVAVYCYGSSRCC